MLRLLGPPTTLCDGLTRRDLLHVGGLGAFGLTLPSFLKLQASEPARAPAAKDSSFGRAKACILLFPYGSPPQHETFDPKPDAPAEVQGELKSIPTVLNGVRVCELLPRIANVMDRVTVVRSVTHPYPCHGVAYAVSGIPTYTPALETAPRDPRHWPFIGSIVDYLEAKRTGDPTPAVPRNVGLPWLLNSSTDLNVERRAVRRVPGAGVRPGVGLLRGRGQEDRPEVHRRAGEGVHGPVRGVRPGRAVPALHHRRASARRAGHAAGRPPLAARAVRRRPRARCRATAARQVPRAWRTRCSPRTRCGTRSTSAASRWRCASGTGRRCSASRACARGGWSRREASSSRCSGTGSASSPAAPGTRTPTTTRGSRSTCCPASTRRTRRCCSIWKRAGCSTRRWSSG